MKVFSWPLSLSVTKKIPQKFSEEEFPGSIRKGEFFSPQISYDRTGFIMVKIYCLKKRWERTEPSIMRGIIGIAEMCRWKIVRGKEQMNNYSCRWFWWLYFVFCMPQGWMCATGNPMKWRLMYKFLCSLFCICILCLVFVQDLLCSKSP